MKRLTAKEFDRIFWNDNDPFTTPIWKMADEYAKHEAGQLEAERKELTEALKSLMEGVDNLPPLTVIQGVLKKEYQKAEMALSKCNNLNK